MRIRACALVFFELVGVSCIMGRSRLVVIVVYASLLAAFCKCPYFFAPLGYCNYREVSFFPFH